MKVVVKFTFSPSDVSVHQHSGPSYSDANQSVKVVFLRISVFYNIEEIEVIVQVWEKCSGANFCSPL